MNEKTIRKLQRSFKQFKLLKKNINLTDQQLNNIVKNSKERFIEKEKNKIYIKYIKEKLITNELTLSKEFKESIFNNEFVIDEIVINKFDQPIEDDINLFDIDDDQLFSDTYTRFNWSYTCDKCKKDSINQFTPIDMIKGILLSFDYSICSDCYNKPDITYIKLNKNMINIVKSYLNPIYTLKVHESGNKYPYTSTLFDWVLFLSFNLDEESLFWLINCNKNSKYYNYVLLFECQNELEIVCHISQFSQLSFFIPHMKKHFKFLVS